MKRIIRTAISLVLSISLMVGCSGASAEVKTTKNNPSKNQTQSSATKDEDKSVTQEEDKTATEDVAGSVSEEEESKVADVSGQHSIEEKNVPFYVEDIEHKEDINLYYVDGSSVPYISMDTVLIFLEKMQEKELYELEYDGEHAIFTRKGTKFTCDFDFENDTITFFDFDAFLKEDVGPIVNVGIPSQEEAARLFKEKEEYSLDRYGKVMAFDLKPYEIAIVHENKGYYAPLQTISDLMLTYNNEFTLYNTEAVFLIPGAIDEDLAQIYYSASGTRTEEFARFDYNELCFALDHEYGLKEIHNITSFDEFFFECGIRKKLQSTDQTEVDLALKQFIEYQLDDIHSVFNHRSYMSDEDTFEPRSAELFGPGRSRYYRIMDEFHEARDKAYPDGVPPYEEIGDTAYITFDSFTHPAEEIDYMSEPKEDELYDTIRLFQYSRDKILRPDSPIKNVVIDLSVNSGGAAVAAAYVIAFYQGLGEISVVNTMTGAAGVAAYLIDSNRDGEFNSEDHLSYKDLNLYCLISPGSFSSGNLVPNVYTMTPRVNLLGMTSGGGSCGVHLMSTAGGSMIQISGYKRVSIFKNGSFYDIDRGATPDFGIAKIADYYDREALTEYIDNLY